MSHQPYETYLFSQETMTKEQEQMLALHIKECEPCRSLAGTLTNLEALFTDSPAPDPAPGFTQRWQVRLSEHRQKRLNRNLWLMTFGLFTLSGLIVLFIFTYHLQNINLAYELSQIIARSSRFIAMVRTSLKLIRSLINTLPIIFPIILVFGSGTFFTAALLTITWFRTIIKLHAPIQERGNIS